MFTMGGKLEILDIIKYRQNIFVKMYIQGQLQAAFHLLVLHRYKRQEGPNKQISRHRLTEIKNYK